MIHGLIGGLEPVTTPLVDIAVGIENIATASSPR